MHAVVHGSYDLVCLLLEAIKRLPAKIPSPFKLYNCFQILNGFDDDGYSPLGYAEKYLESAKEKFGPIIDILKDSGAEDIRPESE